MKVNGKSYIRIICDRISEGVFRKAGDFPPGKTALYPRRQNYS
jgi:hypothetical protein